MDRISTSKEEFLVVGGSCHWKINSVQAKFSPAFHFLNLAGDWRGTIKLNALQDYGTHQTFIDHMAIDRSHTTDYFFGTYASRVSATSHIYTENKYVWRQRADCTLYSDPSNLEPKFPCIAVDSIVLREIQQTATNTYMIVNAIRDTLEEDGDEMHMIMSIFSSDMPLESRNLYYYKVSFALDGGIPIKHVAVLIYKNVGIIHQSFF